MRPTTIFRFALIAFASVPTALAYPSMSEDYVYSRALTDDYGASITARELSEAIYEVVQQRGLADEDAAQLEARLFGFIGKVLGKGVGLISGGSSNNKNK